MAHIFDIDIDAPWKKLVDKVFRKDTGPSEGPHAGTFGESQILCLIKIFIIFIKYFGLNPNSVFMDIGSGNGKPSLVARQILNGPRVSLGIEESEYRVEVLFVFVCDRQPHSREVFHNIESSCKAELGI